MSEGGRVYIDLLRLGRARAVWFLGCFGGGGGVGGGGWGIEGGIEREGGG